MTNPPFSIKPHLTYHQHFFQFNKNMYGALNLISLYLAPYMSMPMTVGKQDLLINPFLPAENQQIQHSRKTQPTKMPLWYEPQRFLHWYRTGKPCIASCCTRGTSPGSGSLFPGLISIRLGMNTAERSTVTFILSAVPPPPALRPSSHSCLTPADKLAVQGHGYLSLREDILGWIQFSLTINHTCNGKLMYVRR